MIGKRIEKYRKLKGYSKVELGSLSGVSPIQIGRYENGKVLVPSVNSLEKLASALDVPLEFLFEDEKYVIDNKILENKFKKLMKSMNKDEDKFALSKVLDSFLLLSK